jgi:hypothetical protein
MAGFGLDDPTVFDWELQLVYEALAREEIYFTAHASDELINDAFDQDLALHTISMADEHSKDLPGNDQGQRHGINFDWWETSRFGIRVKVIWRTERQRFEVVTVHRL